MESQPQRSPQHLMECSRVAKELIAQLGGNQFVVMTGAKAFAAMTKERGGLCFKIGRNDMKVTHVEIVLNQMDTYDVRYLWLRGSKEIVRATSEGIYNDMLRTDFERHTGLYTSLGTLGR